MPSTSFLCHWLGANTRKVALVLTSAVALTAIPHAAMAQTSASPYTTGYRYDAGARLVGTIRPGAGGSAGFLALRNTYDSQGNLSKVETGQLAAWQDETKLPSTWSGFTIFQVKDTTYDNAGRKLTEQLSANGVAYALTQYSYDALSRVDCTAVRMNPAVYTSLPNACTLSTEGVHGPDRITKSTYDATVHVLKVQKAYGTPLQQDYATYTYSANGKQISAKDANGNLTQMVYDGFDRQSQLFFPSKTVTGQASTSDFEQYGYDNKNRRISLKKRDGNTISYGYDNLNRLTSETYPAGTIANVAYDYDLRNLQLFARFGSDTGAGITATYDGFGQLSTAFTNQSGTSRTLSYLYDAEGNRTRVTHPDGIFFSYSYDGLNRLSRITENNLATTVISVAYDAQGRRQTLTRGGLPGAGVTSTTYGYDPVSRLQTLAQDLDGATTTKDETRTFGYSPASQMVSRNLSNALYSFAQVPSVTTNYMVNGLNQYTQLASTTTLIPSYDTNGNMTSDGVSNYSYDVLNRMTVGKLVAMSYDPKGRLFQSVSGASGTTTTYLYDGDALVAEYDASGALRRRYVHGSGVDEPLVWYESSIVNASTRRYFHADHQGSIIAVANGAGTTMETDTYDPYGLPASSNTSRFQYTGQIAVPDLGLYYYKARIYNPALGRFMQTDPIGYKDDLDLYSYVGNDPMNRADPSGKSWDDVENLVIGTVEVVAGTVGVGVGATGVAASTVVEVGSVGIATPITAPAATASVVLIGASAAVAIDGAARVAEGLSGLVSESRSNSGGRQGQGERNRAARPDGTPDPDKHVKEGKGYRVDPQTGKKIPLPPAPKPKPDEPERVPKKNKDKPDE